MLLPTLWRSQLCTYEDFCGEQIGHPRENHQPVPQGSHRFGANCDDPSNAQNGLCRRALTDGIGPHHRRAVLENFAGSDCDHGPNDESDHCCAQYHPHPIKHGPLKRLGKGIKMRHPQTRERGHTSCHRDHPPYGAMRGRTLASDAWQELNGPDDTEQKTA